LKSVVVSVFRYKLFSSSRVPVHQIPLSPAGPQVFLSIFLSQVTKTVVARSCTTIGLINVLYVLILTFFDVYLAFILPLRDCTRRLPETVLSFTSTSVSLHVTTELKCLKHDTSP
jgi:hypothetical protein